MTSKTERHTCKNHERESDAKHSINTTRALHGDIIDSRASPRASYRAQVTSTLGDKARCARVEKIDFYECVVGTEEKIHSEIVSRRESLGAPSIIFTKNRVHSFWAQYSSKELDMLEGQ